MGEGPSDLHRKILENMEAETAHIETSMHEHEKKTRLLMAPKKGFFERIKSLFSGK